MTDFTYYMFRPYFDLSQNKQGPLHAHGPSMAFELLAEPRRVDDFRLLPTRVLPPAFRDNLIDQTGLQQYGGLSPVGVPRHIRSERWQFLCDHVEQFDRLDPLQRSLTCQVLFALGYHELVSSLLRSYLWCPPDPTPEVASLSYAATFARYMLHMGQSQDFDPSQTIQLAQNAPVGFKVKFSACLRMLVFFSRDRRNLDEIAYWREETRHALESLPVESHSFAYYILWSRFYRAASFLPFFHEDKEGMAEEIELALALGRKAVPRNPAEQVVWDTNMVPALQSAAKVSLKLGNLDRMLAQYHERVQLDPWDSLSLIEYGDGLRAHDRISEAADIYRRAASFGPPGTPVAWYLAGCCHAKLGDVSAARDCFLRALRIDTQSTAALEQLAALPDASSQHVFQGWAERHLTVLLTRS